MAASRVDNTVRYVLYKPQARSVLCLLPSFSSHFSVVANFSVPVARFRATRHRVGVLSSACRWTRHFRQMDRRKEPRQTHFFPGEGLALWATEIWALCSRVVVFFES